MTKQEYGRAYYLKHREAIIASTTAYARAHRDEKRAYWGARYRANRAEVLARAAEYRAVHRAEIAARDKAYKARVGPRKKTPRDLAATREWKKKNAPQVVGYMADYRRRNAAALRASNYAWRARNPASVKAGKRRDVERHRLRVYSCNERRRARKLGAMIGPVDYDAVLIRDAGRCGICREPVAPRDLHFDHIIPLSRGGAHSNDNLQVAHARCNLRKGTRCS